MEHREDLCIGSRARAVDQLSLGANFLDEFVILLLIRYIVIIIWPTIYMYKAQD